MKSKDTSRCHTCYVNLCFWEDLLGHRFSRVCVMYVEGFVIKENWNLRMNS